MVTRRSMVRTVGAMGINLPGTSASGAAQPLRATGQWRMPDEAEPHLRTWMAFGASASVWGKRLLPDVQRNLADLAKTIAKYEPVSMLVRSKDRQTAQELFANSRVTLVDAALDDVWIRDTGPTFVVGANDHRLRGAVDLNFNGWGRKQTHTNDAKVAALVAAHAGVQRITTPIVLEGGCIEVNGQGCAIVSESCVLNDNRNPGLGKAECEAELKRLLGLEKIIWIPGIKGRDITDGHTDFYARFAAPNVVLAGFDPDPQSWDHEVTRAHLQILRNATDATGNRLEVRVLQAPDAADNKYGGDAFAAGYVGFYLCNGAVIAQKFGDAKADRAARELLQKAFPGRIVEQLRMDAIAAGGGSIHCVTQQEPLARSA